MISQINFHLKNANPKTARNHTKQDSEIEHKNLINPKIKIKSKKNDEGW